MAPPIEALSFLPVHYGFVAFGGALTFLLHAYQSHTVAQARKTAKIQYPQFYAEKAQMESNPAAYRFNSLQRAHGNTLESMPQLLFGAAFCGLEFPITTGALLAIWVLGRFLFTVGYASGGAENRFAYGGGLHYIGALGVMFLTFYSSATMIYSACF